MHVQRALLFFCLLISAGCTPTTLTVQRDPFDRTRPADCVPLPPTPTNDLRPRTPTPNLATQMTYHPVPTPVWTPYPTPHYIDLSPKLPYKDKVVARVYRCDGTWDEYLLDPAIFPDAIPLSRGDIIYGADPPLSLIGHEPPKPITPTTFQVKDIAAGTALPTQPQPYPIASPLSMPSESLYPKPGLAKTRIAAFYQTKTALPSSTPKPALQTHRASMNQTLTARATATPTPTFPVDALPCQAPDLGISARTGGYPTFLEFYVSIINISHSTCYLQGPADIKLVDRKGDVLDLENASVCFACRIDPTLPSPTRTAIASELLYGKIGIAPNERVVVRADWSEWCKPFPEGGIFVRLILPDGFVEGPTDAYAVPCWLDGDRSYLSVSRYGYLTGAPPPSLNQSALTYGDIPYSEDPLYSLFIDPLVKPKDVSSDLIDLCGIDCVKRIWTDTAERRSFVIVMYQVKDRDQAKKKVEETLAYEIKTFGSGLITGRISLPGLPPHSWIAASNSVKGFVSDRITLQTSWGSIVIILSEQGDIKPGEIPLDDYFLTMQKLAVLQLENLKKAGYNEQ